MQTILFILSAPRLLLENASTAGVVPFETLTGRLSPKMSRLINAVLADASNRDAMHTLRGRKQHIQFRVRIR